MVESEVVLPTKKVEASRINAKRLVLYSKPKSGKTTCVAGLDGCLILDLENGSDYVDAMKVKIDSLASLKKIGQAIIDSGRPYKYIAVDTVTALEDFAKPLAAKYYRETPMGKNFQGDNILSLPNGAGYSYLRDAFFSILDYIDTLADNIILLGHLKDKFITTADAKEVSATEVDLTGKIKSLVCSKADAIGFLYRKDGKTIITFKTSDTITCGARPEHLRNQEIVVAEQQEDGKIVVDWSKIYK